MKNKKLLALILCVSAFIITAVFFKPLVFGNKVLKQHDISMWQGGAKELKECRENSEEEPLWSNSMFGGMPGYLNGTHYNGNYVDFIFMSTTRILPYPSGTIFLAFVSCFVFLLSFRVNVLASAIGALCFAFASFNVISLVAGHNAKVVAISLMPLGLAGINWVFRKKYLLGVIIAALGFSLIVQSGHYQIVYYQFLILGIFCLVKGIELLQEKDFKHLGIVVGLSVASVLVGVGASAGKLLTVKEYGQYSIRGKSELKAKSESDAGSGLDRDYAFAWSQGKLENLTYIVPNLFGGASTGSLDEDSEAYKAFKRQGASKQQALQQLQRMPLYWGDQSFTAGPIYLGAIAVFLFVLSLFVLDKKQKYWIVSILVFGLILSMGKNFAGINYFLFDYLPGLNKFRTPSMAVVIPQLIIAVAAGLAINKVFFSEEKIENLDKKLFYAIGITGGFCLFLIVLGKALFSFEGSSDQYIQQQAPWLMDALVKDRASLLSKDAFRSLFLILASGALIYFALSGKLKKEMALYGVLALVAFDLIGVSSRYISEDNYEKEKKKEFVPTVADQSIFQNATGENYRVYNLNNPFNEARTSYFHHSLGGYHGAKMRRYQDLIERHISQNNQKVLRMLNTQFVITDPNKPAQPFNGLGNAWFVQDLVKVNNPDEEIDYLDNENFSPEQNAVIDASKFEVNKTAYGVSTNASIKLDMYTCNKVVYTSNNPNDGFAVFSEIYYPEGWVATIDGKEANIKRVNYILRALEVPKGKHEIKFTFEPQSYYTGKTLSMIFSSLVLLLCFGGGGFLIYKKVKSE